MFKRGVIHLLNHFRVFRTLVNIFVGRKWGGEMSIFFRWSFEAFGTMLTCWASWMSIFVELNHSKRGELTFRPLKPRTQHYKHHQAPRNGCLLEDDEDPVENRRPIFRGFYLNLNFVGRQQTLGGSPVRNSSPACHSLSPSTSSQRTFGANHIPILGILELNGRLRDMPRIGEKNLIRFMYGRSCLGIIGISWNFRV